MSITDYNTSIVLMLVSFSITTVEALQLPTGLGNVLPQCVLDAAYNTLSYLTTASLTPDKIRDINRQVQPLRH